MKAFLVLAILLLTAWNIHCQINETSQFNSRVRTTCLKISKTQLQLNGECLQQKAEQYKERAEQFIKKAAVLVVTLCENIIKNASEPQQSLQFYEYNDNDPTIEIGDLTMSEYLLTQLNITIDVELTADQQQVLKQIERIEKQEAVYLFGYNLKKLPRSAKTYYLIFYASVVAFALYIGLREVKVDSKIPPKRD